MDENRTVEKNGKSLIDAGLIIAFSTAYVYFCTYRYELGYCQYFKVPEYLIEPNLASLLSFGTAVFLLSLTLMQVLGSWISVHKNIDNMEKVHLKPIYKINLFFMLVCLGGMFVFPWKLTLFLYYFGVWIIVNLMFWAIPALFYFKKVNSIESGIKFGVETFNESAGWAHLYQLVDKKYRWILFALIMVPVFSNFLGVGAAMKQREFYFLNGHSNEIIVRKYGDLLISTRINLKAKKIIDSVAVYKITGNFPIILTLHDIGELDD